jgi:hypothetical protein
MRSSLENRVKMRGLIYAYLTGHRAFPRILVCTYHVKESLLRRIEELRGTYNDRPSRLGYQFLAQPTSIAFLIDPKITSFEG